MIIIRKRAFARAGLLGNPSDGYGGKTLAIIVRNFWAEVVLYEWDSVDIVLAEDDRARFSSIYDLARDVKLHGYYGGIRLVKATVKRFVDYCESRGIKLDDRKFSVRYETNIPRQVGLAGSSAIIVAAIRCLMEFFGVEIPLLVQPSLVRSVEQDELGIACGLQDRVAQVYEGLVYMDFGPAQSRVVDGYRCFLYEPLDPGLLPPLYIAFDEYLSEPTEVFHNDIRGRFDRGDPQVVRAMEQFADVAAKGRTALLARDDVSLAHLIDANFDIRRSIFNLAPWQVKMVETARSVGASAKFAGSGGAIIGSYRDERMFHELRSALSTIGCRTVKPQVCKALAATVLAENPIRPESDSTGTPDTTG